MLEIKIVGISQVNRLDQAKISNQLRGVAIAGQSELKIRQAVARAGRVDSDIILVHAGINNLSSATPQQLSTEIIKKLRHFRT